MPKLSDGELVLMQSVQEEHMMDTCLVAEPTTSADEFNLPQSAWNWNTASQIQCGFNANPSRELLNQVPTSEAVVRLPLATAISTQARIRIIKRFGVSEGAPITYDVIGNPRKGPSGLLVWLKTVTDGSDG